MRRSATSFSPPAAAEDASRGGGEEASSTRTSKRAGCTACCARLLHRFPPPHTGSIWTKVPPPPFPFLVLQYTPPSFFFPPPKGGEAHCGAVSGFKPRRAARSPAWVRNRSKSSGRRFCCEPLLAEAELPSRAQTRRKPEDIIFAFALLRGQDTQRGSQLNDCELTASPGKKSGALIFICPFLFLSVRAIAAAIIPLSIY